VTSNYEHFAFVLFNAIHIHDKRRNMMMIMLMTMMILMIKVTDKLYTFTISEAI